MTDPIKAKIIELCPDIMELKFGCQIQKWFKGRSKDPRIFISRLTKRDDRGEWVDENGIRMRETVLKDGVDIVEEWEYEILGRPITLADVLRAIGRTSRNTSYSIDLQGSFWRYEVGSSEWETFTDAQWNLTKNYDDQTEEMQRFIGSLLGV